MRNAKLLWRMLAGVARRREPRVLAIDTDRRAMDIRISPSAARCAVPALPARLCRSRESGARRWIGGTLSHFTRVAFGELEGRSMALLFR